jgi:ATP-dependent helicase/nuclease subunit A
MSAVELTHEQRAAVGAREVSVALSAGAGCGKTHVLTHRFISHLEVDSPDAARLDQLIAITFTDAASREMRGRIRKACYDRLTAETDRSRQDYWLRLVRELDTARVSTIHAFCTALLRGHAAEVGLDPTFDVLEEGEADVLRFNVMDDVLRARLASKDDDALDLAAAFGLGRLKEQIAALIGRRHEPAFRQWLAATPEEMAEKSARMFDTWKGLHEGESLANCVRKIASKAAIDEILDLLQSVEPTKPLFQEARQNLLVLLPKLKAGDVTQDELTEIGKYARAKSEDGPYICTAKDWGNDKVACQRYTELCKTLRECIDKNKALPWDDDIAKEAAQLGLKLLRLTGAIVAEYQARKDQLGKLDFDDQLALAHQLLKDPKNAGLREELFADLELLLVDEFQDTDPLQIDLVKLVCGEDFTAGRLFFVGDFKQSIYRFRGAQPPKFLNFRQQLPQAGRLPLTLNFRSRPGVLDFVNALFCDEFSEYDRLRPHRDAAAGEPAVEFLWTITPEKNSNAAGAREEARRKEARAIARRLRELVDAGSNETPAVDVETKQARRARPGDIAILLRALSDVRLYEEALREQGLEYYLVGGHAFYAQQEIYDVLNLLRAVASAADEVSLAGVLRSPIFALADESLFWLVDSGGGVNAGLFAEELPPQLPEEERSKVASAAATLRFLRSVKDRVPIATLLAEALRRTGYDAVLIGEFLGERKLANLHKLMEQARTADANAVDLDGFITQLAEFISKPPKEPLASTCSETSDVIRLMTIHRAKGLEFPLVVVPDLDRPPLLKSPVAALDPELGPLVGRPSGDERDPTVTGMTLLATREEAAELEERERLLYVAMTRAADYLILSSSIEDFAKPKSDWMELLAGRFDLATGALVARLRDGYGVPAVHVHELPTADDERIGRPRGPDILKVLDEAHRLAAAGKGVVPREVGPVDIDRAARRQFSFSRLSGRLVTAEVNGHAPSAASWAESGGDAPADPRGFGLLVHDVLARIDFNRPATISEWCEHLAPMHVVENVDAAAQTAREMIERLATSSTGRKLAESAALHREVDFLLAWPLGQSHGDGSMIQGSIDCIYRAGDGNWRIVDYKTNNIAAADVSSSAARYAMQLYVYAMAAEKALGKPPSELVLHFLRPGVEHVFKWNDNARRQAIELVNQAIADSLA